MVKTMTAVVEGFLQRLERGKRPRWGFATWALLVAHTASVTRSVSAQPTDEMLDATNLLLLPLSYATVIAMGEVVHLLLGRTRWPLFLASCLVVGTYSWLTGYAFVSQQSLEWDLIRDNLQEMLYAESAHLIFSPPAPMAAAITVTLVSLGVVLEVAWRFVTRWGLPRRRTAALAGYAVLYLGVFLLPVLSLDEIAYFLQTAWRQSDDPAVDTTSFHVDHPDIDPEARHPYIRPAPAPHDGQPPRRPHVILVAMESFNGHFVGATSPEGRPITPVFNSLLSRGLHVRRFYGNGMQTVRGHFGLLCSVPASYRKKISAYFPGLRANCLPHLLREQGYRTMFYMASRDLQFDQMGAFLAGAGFESIHPSDPAQLPPEQEKDFWPWGLQDDVFFANTFEDLDRRHAEDQRAGGAETARPYFVMMATISHHNPFGPLPASQELVYPEPRTYPERFANSLHVADGFLARFVRGLEARDYLKDSLVIMVGDHGFSGGEHGSKYNHVGSQDEHFRTPFLAWWNGQLEPRVVEDVPFSQLDVAPTVLDLLGIRVATHFRGQSMVSPDARSEPFPLLQPYDGKHVAIIHGRFKYVRHLRSGREHLHDLLADPMENVNVAGASENAAVLARLRREVSLVDFNERLLQENRLWPAPHVARP